MMEAKFILTDYVDQALASEHYDKLEDSTFAGKIPKCPGVVTFAETLRQCEEALRSVKEVESILQRELSVDEWNNLG